MNARCKKYLVYGFITLAFILTSSASAFSAEYDALQGVKSAKAVFDFNVDSPRSAAVHLDLILQTYQDPNLTINSQKPEFVVVFFGPSVAYVSKNRKNFSDQERQQIDAIAATVKKMAQTGIKLEICMTAAHMMGVKPDTILPEIKQVGNGWISLIGYQRQGYALVPNF